MTATKEHAAELLSDPSQDPEAASGSHKKICTATKAHAAESGGVELDQEPTQRSGQHQQNIQLDRAIRIGLATSCGITH